MNSFFIIYIFIFVSTIFPSCDGFNWLGLIDENDCNAKDIKEIKKIISQSLSTIEWDMDINFDGDITPLEVGWQFWENGRLIHWICSDVPSPWYVYNYDCGLSGNVLSSVQNLDKLTKLHLSNNKFYGTIPEELCDMNVMQKSNYWFRIDNNNLCPPFPKCIKGNNLSQDTSDCYEK